jgi:hypothetical protein
MQPDQIPYPQKPKRKVWILISGIIFAAICLCVGAIGAFNIYHDLQEKQYAGKPTPVPEQAYVVLRTAALNRKAGEIGLEVDPSSNRPYGIVMDWNVGKATATLVAFASGDASMYYSTGGGYIGGIGVENIHAAAIRLVNVSGDFVTRLNIVTAFPMPPVGYVRFYIITPQGVYGSEDIDEDSLTMKDIDFKPLYHAAQEVISEIRLVLQK